jgi:hypothetical protein
VDGRRLVVFGLLAAPIESGVNLNAWVACVDLGDKAKKDKNQSAGILQLRRTNTAYQPLPASQRARQVRVGAAAPPKLVATPSPFLSAINYRLQKVAAQQATQHFKLICLGDINLESRGCWGGPAWDSWCGGELEVDSPKRR